MLTSFSPLYWGGTATGRPSWRGTDEPGKKEMEQDTKTTRRMMERGEQSRGGQEEQEMREKME